MELEGAVTVGEIGAGSNCRKQISFEGKFLKQAFDCFDKCCSRDVHDGCCIREVKIERDGTYQHIVPSLPGNVASGPIHWIHSTVATGHPAPVMLPPGDDDNNHHNLDRQNRLSNDKNNRFD